MKPAQEGLIQEQRNFSDAALTAALCGVPAVATMLPLGAPPAESAAPLSVTLPVPDVMTHVTVSVWPALAAR